MLLFAWIHFTIFFHFKEQRLKTLNAFVIEQRFKVNRGI